MMRRSLFAGLALAAIGACGDSGEPAKRSMDASGDLAIAFVRFEGSEEDRFGDIYAMRADGTEQTNLTRTSRIDEEAPTWSPDGTRIAFTSARARSSDVYTMLVDGSERTNLTQTRGISEASPAWSPDGTRIAFVRRKGRFSDVYTMKADGSDLTNLTRTRRVSEEAPAWSPDGTRLVVQVEAPRASDPSTSEGGLSILDADGSGGRPLTDAPRLAGVYVSSPTFAPGSERIAFLGRREGAQHALVWVMHADGSRARPLAHRPRSATAGGPAFSPDGDRIAFEGVRDGPGIYVMNSDGSGQRRLRGGRLNDQAPAWVPG